MKKYTWPLLFTLFGCASQLPPSGGPKDEDPPVLVESSPANNQLNWNEEEIYLRFDEAVQLKDFKNQLLITPTYSGKYDVKQVREEVTIKFDTPFSDSTTYTLNFREGIADLNEANPAENLLLAFSTWGFLDSMQFSGKVHDLMVSKPGESITIALYLAADTITPLNGSPYYLTKSNAAGHFNFHNLKSDAYRVYAFADANGNSQLDSKKEAYGYLSDTLVLDSLVRDLTIDIFRLDLTEPEISSARQAGQYFEIKFPKYITSYELQPLDSVDVTPLFHRMIDDNRTIKVFNTIQDKDSLGVRVTYRDSLLNENMDTVYIKFGETSRRKEELQITGKSTIFNGMLTSHLTFNKPMSMIQWDSLIIRYDSISYPLNDSMLIITEDTYKIKLLRDLREDTLFNTTPPTLPELVFAEGMFLSIESDTSEAFTHKTTQIRTSPYGSISGAVDVREPDFIIQLLDKDNKVIQSFRNIASYQFKEIPAGTYRIRIIIDENANGEWDGGNIEELKQPESVFFFQAENGNQEIELRANWELVDMDIVQPLKDVDNVDIDDQ